MGGIFLLLLYGQTQATGLTGVVAHVYHGDDAGGPIDWSSPVATVAGTSYVATDVAAGHSRRYGIRLIDLGTELEESGVNAVLLLSRDAAGNDTSRPPAGPSGLVATPRSGGTVEVTWLYLRRPDRPDPAQFAIWVQVGTTVDPSIDPDLIIAFNDITYTPDTMRYRATLSGLTVGVAYAVLIRGKTSGVDDGNMMVARFIASGDAPRAPERLTATATYSDMGII